MNVKPKFVYYDIRRKQSVCLIMYTHENDVDTQVLEVSMLDNGEPIELSADYTYSAAIVNRETKALINDSIPCELNDSGNVLIPIDNFHTLGAQDLLIELTISDSDGNQVLVTPFPLWIHVNASILDDAQVTPESQGTVPELLEEAKEALENAGDYENLENKPQINGHELFGNKTGDELGLQGKLTAGENVTIDENGEISATGGTDDYNELNNKPRILIVNSINGYSDSSIQGKIRFNENHFIGKYSAIPGVPTSTNIRVNLSSAVPTNYMVVSNLWGNYNFNQLSADFSKSGTFKIPLNRIINKPNEFDELIENLFITHYMQTIQPLIINYRSTSLIRLVTGKKSNNDIVIFLQIATATLNPDSPDKYDITDETPWMKLGAGVTITSAAVNQNGTITFTMSDGSTVTTTGQSVIGPQGPAGADGNDYVLTAQDKSDIAAIVLSELPTTQGVLYGNTSN